MQVHTLPQATRLALAMATALAILALGAGAAHAAPDMDAEQVFIQLINEDRTAAGLQELVAVADVREVAYAWSVQMATERVMSHNPDFASQITNWTRVAENVGWTSVHDPTDPTVVRAAVELLHEAFMASPDHRANIMDPELEHIGLGVEVRADSCPDGRTFANCLWVTENFRQWYGEPSSGAIVDPYTGDVRVAGSESGLLRPLDEVVLDDVVAGGFDGDHATLRRLGATTDSAIDVSTARFGDGQATHAVLARDDRFPDSLAGSPLSADGPLLFTPTDALSTSVRLELQRVLAPGATVYALGGEGALSTQVTDAVSDAGFEVVRLAGQDRIETALVIADEVRRLYGDTGMVAIARAWGTSADPDGPAGWVDSVTGGAWATNAAVPVLVSPSRELPASVAAWLASDDPTATFVLGGEAALSPAVLDAAPRGVRVWGADRSSTAAAITEHLWGVADGTDRDFVVIDGWARDGWRDGLAAAGLAADADAPMLLATGRTLDQPQATSRLLETCTTPSIDLVLVGTTFGDATAGALEEGDGRTC